MLLLAQAERRLGIADRLAACIADPRDQGRVIHRVADILRARMLTISCGYEDADDLDTLSHDPGFKLALGKLPDGPVGLASQPTMSRWENAPTTREIFRLTGTLSTSTARAISCRRLRSRSTSTIPSTSFTTCSSCRSGTAIMASAASCRSTSTTPRPSPCRDAVAHRRDTIRR